MFHSHAIAHVHTFIHKYMQTHTHICENNNNNKNMATTVQEFLFHHSVIVIFFFFFSLVSVDRTCGIMG